MRRTGWAYGVDNYKREHFRITNKREHLITGLELDANTNISSTSSYSEDIKNSNIINNTENYQDENMRQSAINSYITNITNRTDNIQEIKKNLSNNLDSVSASVQNNNLVLKAIGLSDVDGFLIEQTNKDVQNIANALEDFYEDVNEIVNVSDVGQTTDKKTEQKVDSNTTGTFDNKQTGTSSQKTEQDTGQGIEQDATSETFNIRRRSNIEHILAGIDVNINTNVGIENSSQIARAFSNEENSNINSVKKNTELYNEINNAYNSVIETINKVKNEVDRNVNMTNENKTEQSNNLELDLSDASNLKNFTIIQKNEAKKDVTSSMVLKSIIASTSSNTQKAIMLDMLGATSNFTTNTSTEVKNEQETGNEQTTEQTTTQTTKQTAASKTSIGNIITIIVIVIVLGFLLKMFINKNNVYHPLYNAIPLTNINP